MAHQSPRRGRPSILSHDVILDAAEEMPFEVLSILKLSKHLRVSKTAIYHYFPSRRALCVALVERWTFDFVLPSVDLEWQRYMRALSAEAFRLLCAHPGAADFIMFTGPTGPNQLRILEASLQVLLSAGFTPVRDMRIYALIINASIDAARRKDSRTRFEMETGQTVNAAMGGRIQDIAQEYPSFNRVKIALSELAEIRPEAELVLTIETILAGLPLTLSNMLGASARD